MASPKAILVGKSWIVETKFRQDSSTFEYQSSKLLMRDTIYFWVEYFKGNNNVFQWKKKWLISFHGSSTFWIRKVSMTLKEWEKELCQYAVLKPWRIARQEALGRPSPGREDKNLERKEAQGLLAGGAEKRWGVEKKEKEPTRNTDLCYWRMMYRRCPIRQQDPIFICKVRMNIPSLHTTFHTLPWFPKHSTESWMSKMYLRKSGKGNLSYWERSPGGFETHMKWDKCPGHMQLRAELEGRTPVCLWCRYSFCLGTLKIWPKCVLSIQNILQKTAQASGKWKNGIRHKMLLK